jgi:hypothetical protein
MGIIGSVRLSPFSWPENIEAFVNLPWDEAWNQIAAY